MVAAFSPTSLSRPKFSHIKPSRERHICTVSNTCGCNSRGGCSLLPQEGRNPPFHACNLEGQQERLQDAGHGPRWVPSRYSRQERLGRRVDGERALQAVSLMHRALISPMKYPDAASETGPGPETPAMRTLMLPGLPKGCCSSASSPKTSHCLKTHLKATRIFCSMRFWLWKDLLSTLATEKTLLMLVSSKWQSICRICVQVPLRIYNFVFFFNNKNQFMPATWML